VIGVLGDAALSVGRGRLLVQKTLKSGGEGSSHPNVFAKGTHFTVQLKVYNVGDSNAYEVKVADGWDSSFEIATGGSTSHAWEEIGGGANVTASYDLTPTGEGEFSAPPAVISYKPTSETSELQHGLSTSHLNITVFSAEEYARYTATHVIEWSVFGALFGAVVLAPLGVYIWIQQNYENGIPKSIIKGD